MCTLCSPGLLPGACVLGLPAAPLDAPKIQPACTHTRRPSPQVRLKRRHRLCQLRGDLCANPSPNPSPSPSPSPNPNPNPNPNPDQVISALLFGGAHALTLGRPKPFAPDPSSVEAYGEEVTPFA